MTLADGIKSALRVVPCQLLANGQYAYGSAARIFPASPAATVARGYASLRRFLGCIPDNDVPEPPPPFEGGQCPGEKYNVLINGSSMQGSSTVNFSLQYTALGPIGPLQFTNEGGPLGSFNILQSLGSGRIFSSNCGPNPTPAPGVYQINNSAITGMNPQGGLTITACGADNCGDPDPIYPPPTNINIDIDVTYNNEEGDEINITIPFIFAPINVDITGRFNIPFTFEIDGIEFSGTLNIAPEFSVTINPPEAPTGTDNPTDTLPPGDPEDEVEPREFDDKVIGVVVQSSLSGEQQLTTIATANIPTIFAPRAGSIKFAYSIGVSTFWSNDIDVKGGRVFIPCPFSQGADAVAVSPGTGGWCSTG